MASNVQICNLALASLGVASISSLTEDSQAARTCNLLFANLRDELLRKFAWNFAITRVVLATPTGTAPGRWAYMFQVPVNCMKILYIQSADGRKTLEFRAEADRIYTDQTAVTLVYVQRMTDPNKFDLSFTRALIDRLAYELAMPMTNDRDIVSMAAQRYSTAIQEAKLHGILETKEDFSKSQETDPWLSVRN